ncbi:MAG: hypothetical protein WD342_19840 [Verrucomicrobiales bacterium]
MISKVMRSPNGKVCGKLQERGAIRMGPSLFALEFLPYDFSERLFFMQFRWSEDSKYLAIVEALTAADSERPYTEISIIDFASSREFSVPNVDGRRVSPSHFDSPRFFYTKSTKGHGQVAFEVEFETLQRWRPLSRKSGAQQGEDSKPDHAPS